MLQLKEDTLKRIMNVAVLFNGIRYAIMFLVVLAAIANYIVIFFDSDDFFESRLMLFMHLLALFLVLIFLALLK